MKKIVIVGVLAFCFSLSFAQNDAEKSGLQKEKFFGGGNFGLSLGRYTLINLSPQAGYRFNKYFSAGVGLNLLYASQKEEDIYGNDYRKVVQGITGLNVFTRFYPTQKFLLQLQPEGNYIFGKQIFYQPTKEVYKIDADIVASLLAGGGIVMPTSKGAFITTVMYDVLQNANSPYGNRPIFNVGYNFNF